VTDFEDVLEKAEAVVTKALGELEILSARLAVIEAEAGITKAAPEVEKASLEKAIAILNTRLETLEKC
jgi:hypothetical protein